MKLTKHVIAALLGMSDFLTRAPAASANDAVNITAKPLVVARLVSEGVGEQTYRVVSNVAFEITVTNYVGQIHTNIESIGPLAQLPGPRKSCRKSWGIFPMTIYRANRRTAARPGHPTSQSVLVTFNYSEVADPQVEFIPVQSELEASNLGHSC